MQAPLITNESTVVEVPMHIVQVTPAYPPSTGGVETHVEAISTRLVERGHDVTVISADHGVGNARERRDGVEVIRCRGFTPGGAYHISPGVWQAVRRLSADVVHAHNYHSLTLPAAALGAGDARFVVTPHYHGGSDSSFRDRLLGLYAPVGRRVLRRADEVIAVSEWERDQLAEDFGVDATVIPNGIDVERFADAEPYDHDRPYLLCVGRLEEYKGVQHVIRALPELPEYDLLVAGSGPYREELERIAEEKEVADRVEFLGYVDDEELPGLYAGADVFVTLSEFEAFGMTVGEALAAGTPCVVRDAGALVDWTTNRGVTGVSSVTPSSVADAVQESLLVETHSIPSWEDVVDSISAVYRDSYSS